MYDSMEEVYVIGGDHHNTLGVIRALGYKNINPVVIIVTNKTKPYISRSKYIKESFLVKTDELAVDFLKQQSSDLKHPVVIACSDSASSAIDRNREALTKFYALPGSKRQGRITEIMDKELMTELASEVGLCTPSSWVVQKGGDLSFIELPCITKPLLSKDGQKADICICHNKEELTAAVNSGSCERYQIQLFIEKEFEYQLIGVSFNSGEEIVIPGFSRCIRPCPGTNTGFLHYESLDGLDAPIEKCKEFVKRTGYSGLFSIEFLRGKDGKDYFMEMNFRNDGNAICVTKAGINLPYLWYMANIGLDYKTELRASDLNPIYVMPEFDDFRCFVLTKKISIKHWLSDIRRSGAFMEYDKLDSSPFWHGLKDMIISKLKRTVAS